MALEGRGHAKRALTIVRPPGTIGRGPHLWLQPAVRVDRGTGQRDQAGKMVEDAGHELTPKGREVVFPRGVIEAIDRLLTVPPGEVQMTAVSGLVSPRLGRERGVQPAIEGHAADRFAVEDVMIGGLQRGRIPNRKFLLA